jgi:hypothetical protein
MYPLIAYSLAKIAAAESEIPKKAVEEHKKI